jgi:lycopene cyclase domain-containing protein
MLGEYTIGAIIAPAAVVAAELLVLRTGVLREDRFWVAMAIALAFQIPVDGWLTGFGAAVVLYRPGAISGIRVPGQIPIEDYGFGFALVALTIIVWRWHQLRRPRRDTFG